MKIIKRLKGTIFEVYEFDKDRERLDITINEGGNIYSIKTIEKAGNNEFTEFAVNFENDNDKGCHLVSIHTKDFMSIKNIVFMNNKESIKGWFDLVALLLIDN